MKRFAAFLVLCAAFVFCTGQVPPGQPAWLPLNPPGSSGNLFYNNAGSFGALATGTGVNSALGANTGAAAGIPVNGTPSQTMTPTDASADGLTFASSSLSYAYIANSMWISGWIAWPSNAGTHNVLVAGAPAAAKSNTNGFACGTWLAASSGGVAYIAPNDTHLQIRTTADANVTNSSLSAQTVFISCMYPVS